MFFFFGTYGGAPSSTIHTGGGARPLFFFATMYRGSLVVLPLRQYTWGGGVDPFFFTSIYGGALFFSKT